MKRVPPAVIDSRRALDRKEAPMTIHCGVDFRARMQTVSYCNTDSGEIHTVELNHQKDDLRSF
jgi:hypothetical protein